MIKSLTLKNFKSIENETYSFTNLDLLVGINNSGKSTILQALAIWQYCVDAFARSDRKGKRGVQIVLPDFSALPLPEFNLLWRNKIDRQYPQENGEKKQEFIYIEIIVKWDTPEGKEENFGVLLRYQSPQVVYSSPEGGWERFRKLQKSGLLPKIVYVPPFSGLEPFEEWRDDSIIKRQVGKAQPGSVLRNLLYRGVDNKKGDWEVIEKQIDKLFSIQIEPPIYEKGVDTYITCNYKQNRKTFDIIVGGSGFHQMLTLLAFMFGYDGVTTILLDEPDAHMHANLQREMVDFLRQQSLERNIQFIIATHSRELIDGVDTTSIISILKSKPERVSATAKKCGVGNS